MSGAVNGGALIDFDGYYSFLMERKVSSLALTDPIYLTPEGLRTVSLLHWLFRSTLVLTAKATHREVQLFKEWSRVALGYAHEYADEFTDSAEVIQPNWVRIFDTRIKDTLRGTYPLVDDIQVVVNALDPRLYARSFPGCRTIVISAVTREYLRTFNLILWNHVFAAHDEGKARFGVIYGADSAISLVLPYIVSLYHDVNFSALPAPRAYNSYALLLASQTTAIQLSFMLAHEYGHTLLHEGVDSTTAVEIQADEFAYSQLASIVGESAGLGDLWIATRWFYRLLALERIVGSILCEAPVDWDQDVIMERRDTITRRVGEQSISWQDNICEILGTAVLMRAKSELFELYEAGGEALSLFVTKRLRGIRMNL